jgi:hypothetical protein
MSCLDIAFEQSQMRIVTGFEKLAQVMMALGISVLELIRCVNNSHSLGDSELTWQVARIWDAHGKGAESKYELRGHEHVIECAIFAPISSYPYLADMSQTPKLVLTSSDAADIIPENQCRTSKVCCDWVKRQNSAFVVGARWPTVQDPGRFILLHHC